MIIMKVYNLEDGIIKTVYRTDDGRVFGFSAKHTLETIATTVVNLMFTPGAFYQDTEANFNEYKDRLTLVCEL